MKIKIWEIALLIAIMCSILVGSVSARQAELSENLIRLHVVANSDSDEDQSLKLSARDEVLKKLSLLLGDCKDKSAAEKVIADNKSALAKAAEDAVKEKGKNYPVSVSLTVESFPTVKYDSFTLPTGNYTSLRIIIGEGAGHNWWCVVFPPLCLTAAEEKVSYNSLGISDETFKIISEKSDGYVVKFKLLELISKLEMMMPQADLAS
jgi:stage II sporulation protein R